MCVFILPYWFNIFCRGWQKQKQHSTHTNDRNTDLLKIYDLLFLLLSHFARLLLCIVRNKRQNYIELLTSLFCHIFCITFIVVLSNKESETMIAAPDYAYLILFFFIHLISLYQLEYNEKKNDMLPTEYSWGNFSSLKIQKKRESFVMLQKNMCTYFWNCITFNAKKNAKQRVVFRSKLCMETIF